MKEKSQDPNLKGKRIVFQSVGYSIAQYLRIFFKIIGAIIVAKLLGPTLYGLRNALDLAITFESYSDLGTFQAMSREIPYYRGKGEDENAALTLSSVFGINIIYSLIAGTILILISFYLRAGDWEKKYVDFILFLGILIITSKIKLFYINQLKADKNFHLLSKSEMLIGFVNAIACITLVYFYKFIGLLIGLCVADIILIGYILIKVKKIPTINISFRLIKQLLKIGFPIMLVWLLLTLLRSSDRIVILSMISEEALGYYGVATVVAGVISIIPLTVYSVILPRIMEKLGQTNNINSIKYYLVEPAVITAFFLPIVIASIYYSIHIPIIYFLEKYFDSISVIKILSFALFFSSFAIPLSTCVALNKQKAIAYLLVPPILLNIIINYILVSLNFGLNGVAIGTGVSYFVLCSSVFWFSLKQFDDSGSEIFNFLLFLYSPFFYSILLIIVLDRYLKFDTNTFWSDIGSTFIKFGIFLIFYSFIIVLNRKHSSFKKFTDNFNVLNFLKKKNKILSV